MLRTIWMNIRNTLILFCCIYFAIPIVHESVAAIKRAFFAKDDPRASLPSYRDLPWATEYFKEFEQLDWEFQPFVGWRRKPFTGNTIKLDPDRRNRSTPHVGGVPASPATYFFGGSTMWGVGADDAETIPAFFEKAAGRRAVNFAEIGWTAHQSLNQLEMLITEGERPESVVFYDGVNEVLAKCRSESGFFSHFKVPEFQAALQYQPNELGYYARPLLFLGRSLAVKLGFAEKPANDGNYDCSSDPRKADLIAEALIHDWELARYLVTSYRGTFHAFLQPVSFQGRARVDHIPVDSVLRDQFDAVYPRIRAKMKQAGLGEDITSVLDGDEYAYLDLLPPVAQRQSVGGPRDLSPRRFAMTPRLFLRGAVALLLASAWVGGARGSESWETSPDASRAPVGLSVLSYNTHGLRGLFVDDDPAARFPAIGRLINGYDVALLQEDFAYHRSIETFADARDPRRGNPQDRNWVVDLLAPIVCGDCGAGLSTWVDLPEAVAAGRTPRGIPGLFRLVRREEGRLGHQGAARAAREACQRGRGRRLQLAPGRGQEAQAGARPADAREAARPARARHPRILGRRRGHPGGRLQRARGPARRRLHGIHRARSGLRESGARTDPARWRPRCDYIFYRGDARTEIALVDSGEAGEFRDASGAPLSDHPAIRARFVIRARR